MSKRTRASSASPGRKEQKSQIQLQQDADAEVQGAEVVSPMKKFPQFPLTLGSPLKRLTPNGGAGGAVGGAGVKGAGAGGAGGAGGGGTVSDGRFDLVVGHLLQTFKTLDTVLLTFQRHQKTSTWGAVVDAYQAISPRALLLEDLLHLLDIWGDAYDTRWMPKNHDHEQKPRNFELIVELPNRNDDSTAIAAVTAATVTAATVAAAATATSPGYRLDFTAGAGTTSTNNNSSTTTIATTTSTVTSTVATSTVTSTVTSSSREAPPLPPNPSPSGSRVSTFWSLLDWRVFHPTGAGCALEDLGITPNPDWLASRPQLADPSRRQRTGGGVGAPGVGGVSRGSVGTDAVRTDALTGAINTANTLNPNTDIDTGTIIADTLTAATVDTEDTLEALRERAVQRGLAAQRKLSLQLERKKVEEGNRLVKGLPNVLDALRSICVRNNRSRMLRSYCVNSIAERLRLDRAEVREALSLICTIVPSFLVLFPSQGELPAAVAVNVKTPYQEVRNTVRGYVDEFVAAAAAAAAAAAVVVAAQ